MQDTDRYQLLGTYETPLFEYGDIVWCEWRGDVEIVGITDAKIPWPIGKKGSHKSLVIFDDLADALRRESNQAVCYWWGITLQTAKKWRKTLGIPRVTEGTRRLFSINGYAEPVIEALKRGQAKARDPERLRKLSESRKGKPSPPHVVEAMRAANLGRKFSAEHRAKISERNKRMGIIPPKAVGRLWTAEEDEAVRTLSVKEAAEKTGGRLWADLSAAGEVGRAGCEAAVKACGL